MYRIDAHAHWEATADDVPLLRQASTKLLNICFAGPRDWRPKQAEPYRQLAQAYPDTFAWCTTFSAPDFSIGDRDYAQGVIDGLARDFAAGAIGCKVWKNIGMEIADPLGRHLMIDDPIFLPVFAFIEQSNRPLLMHIGEPLACWLPLDERSPHYGYYKAHPQWHMHGRSDMPSHEALMAARDRVLAWHPKLRVIGAHLGSLEYDLSAIAQRLDRYPNFAIDTSGRLEDLAMFDREELRQFILRYQDRILWGTDVGLSADASDAARRERSRQWNLRQYDLEAAFFATDQPLQIGKHSCRGLALPADVLAKLFSANTQRWYPGV